MALGGSSKDSGRGGLSRPTYYSGRGADSYLKSRPSGRLRLVGAVLAGLLVLAGVGAGGYVLGRRSVENGEVTAGGSTTVDASGTTTAPVTAPSSPTETTRPEIYIVQAGDSLAKIAKRFNTTIAALVQLNGIANPDRLIEGTTLKIPPPTPPSTAPPTTAPAPPAS